jgi:hypothetical protein
VAAADDDWGTTTRAMAEAMGVPSGLATIAPGTRIGDRFRVIGQLGAGGMGIVYRAHDEKLSRDVAIKVHARETGATRLEREATAMAQLSHPNVVAVYELGMHEGAVFIAMELVDGETARKWLERAPRTWREIVRLYCAAGEGLAAVHAAGLVHRDFKPDNVLVGSDGRVRVADLGLARAVGQGGRVSALLERGPATSAAGTPAYMAPEQRAGGEIDARTDQYAFATALLEALAGKAPRRVRRALTHATVDDPAARWPTLRALLAELGRDPAPRRIALGASALVIAGVATAFAMRRPAPCGGGRERVARVWNASVKKSIHDALAVAGLADVARVSSSIEKALDAYGRRWVDAYADACEATRVHGSQSEELLDRRMACLDSRLEEARSLTALLQRADAALAQRATSAVDALTPVDGCADVAALTNEVPPPTDPAVRSKVADVRKRIAGVKAYVDAGRYSDAQRLLEPLTVDARALGYGPLTAESEGILGAVHLVQDHVKEAEAVLRLAAYDGEAARSDLITARAWVNLVFLVGFQAERPKEGHELARLAEASIKRLPTRHRELEAMLLDGEGALCERERKYDQAIEFAERALALRREVPVIDEPRIANGMNNLAELTEKQRPFDPAAYERSLEYYEQERAIMERTVPAGHPDYAYLEANVAIALAGAGRPSEAAPRYEHALAALEAAFGKDSSDVPWLLMAWSETELFLHHFAHAEALARRALAIRVAALGPDHADVAPAHSALARILVDTQRWREGADEAARAVAILERGDAARDLMDACAYLGDAQLGLKAYPRARDAFERAAAIGKQLGLPPAALGGIWFGQARASWAAGDRDHARLRALAKAAREGLAAGVVPYRSRVAEVDAWLEAHR